MAPTMSAFSGSTIGEKRCDHLAVAADEELLEVPADVAGVAFGVGASA